MKKAILLAGIILLAASCSKDPSENVNGNETKGNLVVNVFEIEHTPFSAFITRTPPAEVCTRINFAVYSLDGTRIKQVNQQLGDAGFGTASM